MGAYITKTISPLSLKLDSKNPRFILPPDNTSEREIILYLCENEAVDKLCNRLNDIGTILPGERIVVCEEAGEYVVLEGNRRISCCKMLLDPDSIPESYRGRIKPVAQETKSNITHIEVDVVPSRESAKKYLVARHINGVRDWTTIAKMNFVADEFKNGKNVEEISEISSLNITEIKRHLKNWSLLTNGIQVGTWTKAELSYLNLTVISPDKYLRIFSIGSKEPLQLYYDEKFTPHSKRFSDKELREILTIFIRGAFIDDTINTRNMSFQEPHGFLYSLIKPIIEKQHKEEVSQTSNYEEPLVNKGHNTHQKCADSGDNADNKQREEKASPQTEEVIADATRQKKGKTTTNLPLFGALNGQNIDNKNPQNRGLISIVNEIIKFSSNQSNPRNYPIAAAILTRCLIENTLIYFLRERNLLDALIKQSGGSTANIKLNKLVDYYIKRKSDIFEDANVKARFLLLFDNYDSLANPLNWVVHQLNAYKMTTETLQKTIDEGLFDVLQHMLSYKRP